MDSIVEFICKKQIGTDCKAELISRSKHYVYKIIRDNKMYILKLFNDEASILNNAELTMYDALNDCRFTKKCICKEKGDSSFSKSYIITEYIEGDTLLEMVENESLSAADREYLARQVLEYINYCGEICDSDSRVSGLDSSNNWYTILKDIIEKNIEFNMKLEECKNRDYLIDLGKYLLDWVENNRSYFQNVKKVLIPVDMNLNNFMTNKNLELRVIDLDAFLLGDRYLALGEFFGHIYGTELFNHFFRLLPEDDLKYLQYIHFYAALSNYSVLSFSANSNLHNLQEIKPWGNKDTFFSLIQIHTVILKNYQKSYYVNGRMVERYSNSFKKSSIEKNRVVTTSSTLDKVMKLKEKAGITRVPDIKNLDYLGIPAFQCVRPAAEKSEDTFSVFSGKGKTEEECKVGAIVEGIERFCAEKRNYDEKAILVESYKSIKDNYNVINPIEFNLPKGTDLKEDEVLEWVSAYDIISGGKYYILANAVFYPYNSDHGRSLFRYYTTGLAAGNTYDEAIHHGIAEVIERDAAALNILLRRSPVVTIDSIESNEIRTLINKITDSGLKLIIRYITSPDINIPAFSIIIDDVEREDTMYISGGYAAHTNKDVALMTAINEAVLSRVSTISGAREDLEKFEKKKGSQNYKEYKIKYSYWFDESNSISYDQIDDFKSMYIDEDIMYMVDCIKEAGFEHIFMVDLTNPTIGFPVLKIIIPGIERYSWKRTYGRRAHKYYKFFHK